jgi:hypothetical protein
MFSLNKIGSKIIIFLLTFYGLIAWSPIVATEGRGALIALFIFAMLFFAVLISNRKINSSNLLVVLFVFTVSLFASVRWGSVAPLLAAVWIIIALLLFFYSTLEEKDVFLKIATIWCFILLFGAYISVIYVLLGYEPLTFFINPDGRENYVLLGTFSNTIIGTYMRPAGFYDEPGAFSYLLCAVVALRFSLGKSNKVSGYILLLGLITFSLAHVIFSILFLFTIYKINLKKIIIYILLLTSIVLVFSSGFIETDLFDDFWRRLFTFVIDFWDGLSQGTLSVGNRTEYIDKSLSVIGNQLYSPWFGYDSECFISVNCNGQIDSLCCDPYTPAALMGIIGSWVYYFLLFIMVTSPLVLGRSGIVLVGLALVNMQRPALLALGYSLLSLLPIGVLISRVNWKKILNYDFKVNYVT